MTPSKNGKPSVQENIRSGNALPVLQSPGGFAGSPLLGITMVLLGSLIFGALAYSLMTNEAFPQWDLTVAKTFRAMQANAPWSLMEDMLFGVFLGKEVVLLVGNILAIYFLHQRFWRELAMVSLGLGGGALLWFLLSRAFDRPRPADHLDVLYLSGPSFPSGPALMAILCYGLLAYLLVPNLPTRFWKWFVALLCALVIVMVGMSALLFGTHHATDVIAGIALGLAWAGLIYTLVERTIPGTPQTSRARHGLRTPGLLPGPPRVAWLVFLFASLIFAAISLDVLNNGKLAQLDQVVYRDLLGSARAASPLVNDLILFGFFIGKQMVQWIALILSIYFLSQRYWLEFAMLQISTQGGGLIKNLIIDYFARTRPPDQLGFITTGLSSFPSGHALGTTILYGFLAYLVVPRMPSRFWKWVVSLGFLLLILFEGFSRIFHGNHYLTDVLAAYALGIAWLGLVCTVMEGIFMRSRGNKAGSS